MNHFPYYNDYIHEDKFESSNLESSTVRKHDQKTLIRNFCNREDKSIVFWSFPTYSNNRQKMNALNLKNNIYSSLQLLNQPISHLDNRLIPSSVLSIPFNIKSPSIKNFHHLIKLVSPNRMMIKGYPVSSLAFDFKKKVLELGMAGDEKL